MAVFTYNGNKNGNYTIYKGGNMDKELQEFFTQSDTNTLAAKINDLIYTAENIEYFEQFLEVKEMLLKCDRPDCNVIIGIIDILLDHWENIE